MDMQPSFILGTEENMGIEKELAVFASGDQIIPNIHEDGVKFQRMLQIIAVLYNAFEYFNKENARNDWRPSQRHL